MSLVLSGSFHKITQKRQFNATTTQWNNMEACSLHAKYVIKMRFQCAFTIIQSCLKSNGLICHCINLSFHLRFPQLPLSHHSQQNKHWFSEKTAHLLAPSPPQKCETHCLSLPPTHTPRHAFFLALTHSHPQHSRIQRTKSQKHANTRTLTHIQSLAQAQKDE